MTDITLDVSAGTIEVDSTTTTLELETGVPSSSNVVRKTLFDANTILKADTDDTPEALTVAEQTLVGRITSGTIDALTAAEVRTMLGLEDLAEITDWRSITHPDYAATGDGATDDTTAVQAAVTWQQAASGRGLIVPNGTYILSDEIDATTRGLTMIGAGCDVSIFQRTGNYGNTFNVGAGATYVKSIQFNHSHSYTPGDTSLDNAVTGTPAHFVVTGGQKVKFYDNTFFHLAYAVLFKACTYVDCRTNRYVGIWDPDNSGVQEGIACFAFQQDGSGNPSKDIIIIDNRFAGYNSENRTPTYGTYTHAGLALNIGTQSAILFEDAETAVVTNNYCGGMSYNFVKYNLGASDVVANHIISNNTLDACGDYQIAIVAANTNYVNNLVAVGNICNNQGNGQGFFKTTDNGSGTAVLTNFVIENNETRNGIGAQIVLDGVIGGKVSGLFTGFNYYGGYTTDLDKVSAVYVTSNSSLVHVDNVAAGGGGNLFSGTNNCKYAVAFGSASAGTIGTGIANLGLGASGASLTYARVPSIQTALSVTGTIENLTTGGNKLWGDISGSVGRYGTAAGGGSAMTANYEYVNGGLVRQIDASGNTFQVEVSAASADQAGWGQWWVKNDTPNVPMFTDDAGSDWTIANLENLASTANGKGASLIGIEDSGTLITATTVEGALAENRTAINAKLPLSGGTMTGNINMDAHDVILRDGDTYFSNGVDNLIRYVVTSGITFDIWSTFVESWVPLLSKSYIKTQSTTVASLTAASTAGAGARSFVTDATSTTFASTVAGGGANAVPVYSDGTNWKIG